MRPKYTGADQNCRRYRIHTLLELNRLHEKDIISLQFSITSDITAANPATLLRSAGYASATVLLQCGTEYRRQSSWYNPFSLLLWKKKAVPVYLGEAEKLRPDLFNRTV